MDNNNKDSIKDFNKDLRRVNGVMSRIARTLNHFDGRRDDNRREYVEELIQYLEGALEIKKRYSVKKK